VLVDRPHSVYREIAAELRRRILAGEWEPAANLPRMKDLAAEFGVNRDTVARAVAILEAEGLVWAVPRRGTIIRYGMLRQRRPRGDLVKRNVATDGPGYSFPSASGQEVWQHHVPRVSSKELLDDPRIARFLGVPAGSMILRRHRVTGPVTEPPFQICDTWIHPRVADVPGVADAADSPGDWLYRLETAGHWPIEWLEYIRSRMSAKQEAELLQIPPVLPVVEIVRVGRSGADGQPVEVTVYVIPADRVEIVHPLRRDESAAEPWPEPGS
jgi:DNA-binding GntR family transcriptional regulator